MTDLGIGPEDQPQNASRANLLYFFRELSKEVCIAERKVFLYVPTTCSMIMTTLAERRL